jgi:hypothetical protein
MFLTAIFSTHEDGIRKRIFPNLKKLTPLNFLVLHVSCTKCLAVPYYYTLGQKPIARNIGAAKGCAARNTEGKDSLNHSKVSITIAAEANCTPKLKWTHPQMIQTMNQ